MSCDRTREQLNDYVDGLLPADRRLQLEEHLDGCLDCQRDLAELRELLGSARALPREIEPEQDLWPGIEHRIRRPEPAVAGGRWWSASWIGLAAAAVLVVAVAIQIGRREDPVAPARSEPVVESTAPSLDYVLVSEEVRVRNGLMHVREDLMRSIVERRGSLDPETQKMIEHNLALIDQAITEIHQALGEDPDNQRLEFLLAATYQREAEMLKKINLL